MIISRWWIAETIISKRPSTKESSQLAFTIWTFSKFFFMFLRATDNARGHKSEQTIFQEGLSEHKAKPIAPDPVPRSSTFNFFDLKFSKIISTKTSVSGLGTKTR